ncbi:hypothetical protein, partial [Listeria seeligeri]|uniref:hypothetical protein n=1 Tax=Listeria seeligeri TaxID=1640 RepID=UPI001BDAF1BF
DSHPVRPAAAHAAAASPAPTRERPCNESGKRRLHAVPRTGSRAHAEPPRTASLAGAAVKIVRWRCAETR